MDHVQLEVEDGLRKGQAMNITEATFDAMDDDDEPLTKEWLEQVSYAQGFGLYKIGVDGVPGRPLFSVGKTSFGLFVGVELSGGFRGQYAVRTRKHIRRFAAMHRMHRMPDGDLRSQDVAGLLIGLGQDSIDTAISLVEMVRGTKVSEQ